MLFDGEIVQTDPFYVHPGTTPYTHTLTLDPADYAGLQAAGPCPADPSVDCEATHAQQCVDSETQQATVSRRLSAWQQRAPLNNPV